MDRLAIVLCICTVISMDLYSNGQSEVQLDGKHALVYNVESNILEAINLQNGQREKTIRLPSDFRNMGDFQIDSEDSLYWIDTGKVSTIWKSAIGEDASSVPVSTISASVDCFLIQNDQVIYFRKNENQQHSDDCYVSSILTGTEKYIGTIDGYKIWRLFEYRKDKFILEGSKYIYPGIVQNDVLVVDRNNCEVLEIIENCRIGFSLNRRSQVLLSREKGKEVTLSSNVRTVKDGNFKISVLDLNYGHETALNIGSKTPIAWWFARFPVAIDGSHAVVGIDPDFLWNGLAGIITPYRKTAYALADTETLRRVKYLDNMNDSSELWYIF